jgi:hypothetical protein
VMNPRRLEQREKHIADMILRYVRRDPDARPHAAERVRQSITRHP